MKKYNSRFYRCVPTYVYNISRPFFKTKDKLRVGVPHYSFGTVANSAVRSYAPKFIYTLKKYVRTYTYTTAIAIGGEQAK